MQSSLTNAHTSITPSAHIASLKKVIIYQMHTLSNLYYSYKTFRQELAAKSPYQASIRDIKLRLVELKAEDSQARKIRVEKLGGNSQDFNEILHYQGMPYILEIIRTKLISKNYNNL